jgi:hypothetical protein
MPQPHPPFSPAALVLRLPSSVPVPASTGIAREVLLAARVSLAEEAYDYALVHVTATAEYPRRVSEDVPPQQVPGRAEQKGGGLAPPLHHCNGHHLLLSAADHFLIILLMDHLDLHVFPSLSLSYVCIDVNFDYLFST